MITFQDFQKIDLRIAKVLNASGVEGAEKLLKLEIDLGDEKRQIIAGLAESYAPEDLIGKEIVVVANLEPRTVFGLESQGMLLAATDKGKPALLVPNREVTPGARVQ